MHLLQTMQNLNQEYKQTKPKETYKKEHFQKLDKVHSLEPHHIKTDEDKQRLLLSLTVRL